MGKSNSVIVKRTYGKSSSFYLNKGVLGYFDEPIDSPIIQLVNVYYIEYRTPVFGDYTYDEYNDSIVLVVSPVSRFTNTVVLTNDKKIIKKNSKPTSYHDNEDLCPSCYSPVNIDKDLDENDTCNLCRIGEPGPGFLDDKMAMSQVVCDLYNNYIEKNQLFVEKFLFNNDVITGGSITLYSSVNYVVERDTEFHIFNDGKRVPIDVVSMLVSEEKTELKFRVQRSYYMDINELTNDEILKLEIFVTNDKS